MAQTISKLIVRTLLACVAIGTFLTCATTSARAASPNHNQITHFGDGIKMTKNSVTNGFVINVKDGTSFCYDPATKTMIYKNAAGACQSINFAGY